TAVLRGPVHGSIDRGRHEPDILHDVDLAAGRPTHRVDVGTEGPDRGPGAISSRDLRAHLDATISECGLALRGQAGRGDLVALPEVAAGLDDEVSILDARVLQAPAGVVLELRIAQVPDLVAPFGRIGVSAAVEFVGPDQIPARKRRWPRVFVRGAIRGWSG